MIQRDSMARLYGRAPAWIHFHRLLALACALVLPGLSDAAEFQGSARIHAAAGPDTNARRAYNGDSPDAPASLQLTLQGGVRGDGWLLTGGYDGGVRKFFAEPSEDTLVQQANAEGAYRIADSLAVGLDTFVKDRRGAQRSYTDLSGRLFLTFSPDAKIEVRLSGGARRYWYHPALLAHSYTAGEGSLSARYRLDRHHAFTVFGDYGQRRFGIPPRLAGGGVGTGVREDLILGAGVGYAYRGPFNVSVSYVYFDEGSNAYGERLVRHRLTATYGMRLPWELVLLAQGALQLTSYPDGVFLSPEQQLSEDDENHNNVSLKLLRPITDRLDAELRYALYQNALPQNGFRYFRQVATVGLTFRF